jgi:hypothetical protein
MLLGRRRESGNVNYLPLASTPPGYGYISGTVLNGTGIQGASATTNTSNTTTADASGFYYFLVLAGAYNLTATMEPVFYSNSSVIVTAISGVAYLFISYDSVHPSEYKSKLQMRKYGKKCRNKRTFCEKYE